MTNRRQFEANRRNAQKSTGPKTVSGKHRSSRNALRHGLSLPLVIDANTTALKSCLVSTFDINSDNENVAVEDIANGYLEVARVRRERARAIADLVAALQEGRPASNVNTLCRMERYERLGGQKWRRGLRILSNPIAKPS
jgi:hypothetical protein